MRKAVENVVPDECLSERGANGRLTARPSALHITDLDVRCPPMIYFVSDVLTQQQRWEEANSCTADGVAFDPLFDLAWVLRGKYYLGVGDIAAAEGAERVQALYPEGAADPVLVETLMNDIALAKEQG